MKIEVYADVVCPWCYIGERKLQKALESRPDLEAEWVWRPYQLRPEMPPEGRVWKDFAREKFGGEEWAKAAFEHVTLVDAREGLRFDFDRVASAPNTADAHRAILHAARFGAQREVADALFRAYFSEGKDLNDHHTLVEAASSAGLDGEKTRSYLASRGGFEEVEESQKKAASLGVTSVPFYVFDGRYAVAGSDEVEGFVRSFEASGKLAG